MADPNQIDPSLTQIPGLSQYMAMKQYMINQAQQEQARGLQQEFLQKRQALGPNPSPQALMGLSSEYLGPKETVDLVGKHLDRQEATAARLMTAHQLAQYRIDNLERMRDSDVQRAKHEDTQDLIKKGYNDQILELKKNQDAWQKEMAQLRGDIAQQNADTSRMRVEQQGSKLDEPLLNMLDKIDATKRMIQANPEAVGGRGMLGRGAEFIGSMVNPGQETPASNLQSQILDLQTTYRGLPGHAASRLKIDAANIDKLIKGLGTFTAPDQAIGSLNTLRETIAKQLERRTGATPEAATEVPPAIPSFPPAPADPAKRKANETYLTPRGPLKWTGTGWVPK